jgi:hypothetical protein
MSVIEVTYFSNVLCIWAYASQARVDAVKEQFGGTVSDKASVLLGLRRYSPEDHIGLE